ncbi:MAG TPA: pectinesterase family protein [Opitutaceae bacterium]|nr:pectinesterase family protein [Opitutaceae bacterium]
MIAPDSSRPARWLPWTALAALLAAGCAAPSASTPAAAPAAPAPAATASPAPAPLPALFVCGDSTAAPDGGPIVGWGEKIGQFFDPAKVKVENHAAAGRSARTYIEEGRWEAVRRRLHAGDVVLLQFGHNDTKSALSISRYDLSGLGDEVEHVTDPVSGKAMEIRTFGYYMDRMVKQGTAAGATVVVLSPIPRSKWSGGKIVLGEEGHGPWAAAVARKDGVPFLDVNAKIAAIYDPIGQPRIKALYFPRDNTHTNPAGAVLNAAVVTQGLIGLNDPVIAGYLRADAGGEAAAVVAGVARAAAEVPLSLPLKAAFPAPGATDVPIDTPLRLTFNSPPSLGTAGMIRIYDAADNRLVDSIDVSSPTAVKAIGGIGGYRYYPVMVSGSRVGIYFKNSALAYGHSYYVTVDAGVFREGADGYAALRQPAAWRFSTKAAPPAAGASRLVVAADGSGDFCTVQGALDFIPDGNTRPVEVYVKKGTYPEIIFFTHKDGITLRGESRKETVIEYATNDRFNSSSGNPYGTPGANPSLSQHVYRRGVLLAHRVHDFTLTNLTVRNTTPKGGSQAEAIIFNGLPDARAVVKDVDLYSFQDTLQINGQAYIEGCYIEGDVDFMWGNGPSFFENCVCRSVSSGCYYTQIRNPATNHGFVYLHCTFDGMPGIMGNYLSRIEPNRFPASEVVLIDCVEGHAVLPEAWQLQGYRGDLAKAPKTIRFWEYNSHDAQGRPVDVSERLAISRQLRQPADAEAIAHYSDPQWVLGGWDARKAAGGIGGGEAGAAGFSRSIPAAARGPEVTAQPASQIALLGTDPFLSAAAAGAGRLSYQWNKDGTPIPGATDPILRISGMTMADAANYTVTVTGRTGSVTSEAAELTAVAPATGFGPLPEGAVLPRRVPGRPAPRYVRPPAKPAPKLPEIPEAVFDATTFGAKGDGSTDNTAALQRAIEAATEAGGGIVFVPAAPRPYLFGPIELASRVNLQLDFGATLKALPYGASRLQPRPAGAAEPPGETKKEEKRAARREAKAEAGGWSAAPGSYPLDGRGRFADLISARGAHDVAITGGGTIDGDGAPWWAAFRADHAMPHRPFLIRLTGCERVLISGLTLTNSPMFHVAVNADQLTVFGLTVRAPISPNTDGVDPSGSHQLIQDCRIACGDDNIAVKAGGAFCSDLTVADCLFGIGHGLSVGGQSNAGLDGMTVRNCFFEGGTAGLRLKADATQGGPVRNISYSDLVMEGVQYPIEFYSYYNKVGNPGETSGRGNVTPQQAAAWNARPPNSLRSRTLPSWRNIAVTNLTSTRTRGYGIIWGLPLADGLVQGVRLANVRLSGGPGFKVYDAADVQFSGATDVGALLTSNALVITRQPAGQLVVAGGAADFSVAAAGSGAAAPAASSYQWILDGRPLADGPRPDGAVVSGSGTAHLRIERAQPAEDGRYAAVVSNRLDGFDVAAGALAAGSLPVSATSAPAELTVK